MHWTNGFGPMGSTKRFDQWVGPMGLDQWVGPLDWTNGGLDQYVGPIGWTSGLPHPFGGSDHTGTAHLTLYSKVSGITQADGFHCTRASPGAVTSRKAIQCTTQGKARPYKAQGLLLLKSQQMCRPGFQHASPFRQCSLLYTATCNCFIGTYGQGREACVFVLSVLPLFSPRCSTCC